jgi:phosphoglycolate phosphatase
MQTRLLLWDIDGTLIDGGGGGERSLLASMRSRLGLEGSLDWLAYYGRTDRWIAREILVHYGFPANAADVLRFVDGYLEALPREMANPSARVLPGVETLLKAAAATPGVCNALLTGNMERGAAIKLGHLGLWHHFKFGAYADDSETRNDLGPVAIKRASERLGQNVSPDQVVVIGDTPHDIDCGRACGAHTVAVATGKFTPAELADHKPDALLADFSNLQASLRALGIGA